METTNAYKQKRPFFEALQKHIGDPHTRHEYWAYLMSLDLAGADWERERPLGTHHLCMARLNLCPATAFLCHLVIKAVHARESVLRYQATVLLDLFNAWLQASNFQFTWTAKALGGKLSPLSQGPQSLNGFRKSDSGGSVFYTITVQQLSETLLEMNLISAEEVTPVAFRVRRSNGELVAATAL
jgi:hypothetical protein